jgi:serpin B
VDKVGGTQESGVSASGGTPGGPAVDPQTQTPTRRDKDMKPMLFSLLAVPLLLAPAAPAADGRANRATVVKGNNQFALDLYRQLHSEKGNLFFSPYSISTALAMTYAGARNQTAEQMAKTLHFTLDNADLHPAFGLLIHEINGKKADSRKRGYQLSTANALWVQKGYPFLPAFLKLTRDNYGAGEKTVDFAGAIEQARKTINAWVDKETQHKIKELLPEGTPTTGTRLVLTNAIYFKAEWESQFKKNDTAEDVFHVTPRMKVKAPLMHQIGKFGYFKDGTVQGLEMPYVGNDLSMVVLLPTKVDGLPDLEKRLTASQLAAWLGKLRKKEVAVTLPTFKTTKAFQLKKALSGLGMSVAFSDEADFSGINEGKRVSISEVIHEAFVNVTEKGTEAAAATAAVAEDSLADPTSPPAFRADHPFVFLIRHRHSDSILFLGRVVRP